MIEWMAKGVVLAAGLYLAGLGVALLARPAAASNFLMGHATSAPLHYLELGVRIGVGLAFVQNASAMLAAAIFSVFGWVLVGTSAVLLMVPWQWHRRLAGKFVPQALRFTPLLGLASLLMGGGVLVAAIMGPRQSFAFLRRAHAMFRTLWLLALLCLSNTVMAASAIFGDADSQAEFDQRLSQSPIVTRLKAGLPTQCAPAEVELHYKRFNLFNSPDLIVDWQFHYVVAPASKPAWRGGAVADIAEYSAEMDDARALAVLQAKASELGGCAVTTIFREPVTLAGSDTNNGSYQRSRIIGYVYYGKIVRKR